MTALNWRKSARVSVASSRASVEDLRVYDRALDATEIQIIANAKGLDGIEGGQLARWPMRDTRPDVSGQDFYSAGGTNTATNSLTITMVVQPENEDDDTMIMVIVSEGDSTGTPENLTTPAGWTHMNAGQTDLPATASTPSVWIYRRTAASEPANYVVTGNQAVNKIGTIMNYKGIPASEDVISSINTGTTAAPIAPSITPSAAALYISVVAADDNDLTPDSSDNFPADVNGRKSVETGGVSPNGCSMLIATELVDAGATGTRTFSLVASEEWGTLSIAFLAGQGVTGEYLRDVSDNALPSIIQSAPIFKEESPDIRYRRRAA